MTTVLIFILLIIIAVVAVAIINQNNSELGSKPEDILVEQARVLELKAQLEKAEARERKELEALRREMRILEKENAKNVLTLEKELIASGLKGKAAEDALRKELEDTKRAEQAKVDAIQLQLTKTKTQEAAKVKSLQFELDKSQARIGIMEKNVEKLKTKPAEELAKLKSELAAAKAQSSSLKRNMEKITSGRSEAAAELKALQDELNELKKAEAVKISTLKEKLGDSTTTIEDLEDEIAYLKSGAAIDKSPDTEKNNFPIESDEVRASAMESQNIVENDVKKNSETKDSSRVMNKGPDSLKLSQVTMEKLKAVARKAKEEERNEEIKKRVIRPGPKAPKPTPELIRLGPPGMIKPAVCRDIPGSPVDSCGRPSMGGRTPIKAAPLIPDHDKKNEESPPPTNPLPVGPGKVPLPVGIGKNPSSDNTDIVRDRIEEIRRRRIRQMQMDFMRYNPASTGGSMYGGSFGHPPIRPRRDENPNPPMPTEPTEPTERKIPAKVEKIRKSIDSLRESQEQINQELTSKAGQMQSDFKKITDLDTTLKSSMPKFSFI